MHSVSLCAGWASCESFNCGLRHSSNRRRKCKYGRFCASRECIEALHPRTCPNQNCLRLLCSERHVGSSLQSYLLQLSSNKDTITDKREAKILKTINIARKSHTQKMTSWLARYRVVQSKVDGGEEKEENAKVLEAMHKEGKELQMQLDYFDESVYNCLQSLNSNGNASASTSNKTFVILRIHREVFRLKEALPALSRRQEIEAHLRDSQFIVVKGETGSGKSTQLPQYIWEYLSLQNLHQKKVICTQPRKVSATSLAERVAFEWGAGNTHENVSAANAVGQMVGFRVGSMKKLSSKTRIEYCTEGSFLKCLLNVFENNSFDPLKNVGAIVIDEAHERSISCDIILGILKDIAPKKWPNVKIVITSATLNTTLFGNYFYNCPIVEIPGRMYPVDVAYQPIPKANFGVNYDANIYLPAAVDLAFDLHKHLNGDILCFLTGQDEVEKAKDLLDRKLQTLSKSNRYGANVLTLFGKQTADEQKAVFTKIVDRRKIVFSTDVAETGVTIDGIRHVIDVGLCKESRYDPSRNVTVLEVDAICKSSATQRAGRAGRTAPGTCYRLYKEDDFEAMEHTQTAEVLCRPLALTFLNLLSMGIKNPAEFNWLESPAEIAFSTAVNELIMLDCIIQRDNKYELTDFGKVVVALQIDPSMAKLVYNSALRGYGRDGCMLAGILSVSGNFYWRGGDQGSKQAADGKHLKFASPKGDLVGMFRAFCEWKQTILEAGNLKASPVKANKSFKVEEDLEIGEEELSIVDDDDNTDSISSIGEADSEMDMFRRIDLLSTEEEESLQEDRSLMEDDFTETNSAVSNISEMIDDLELEEEIDLAVQAELRRMEQEEFQILKYASNREVRKWCSDNCINSKSLQIALSTALEMMKELSRLPRSTSCWRSRAQNGDISEEIIQRVFFDSYFMNMARQIKSNKLYSVLRNQTGTAYIHPGSAIVKLSRLGHENGTFPQNVVFHSMLSTSKSFMIGVVPVPAEWLEDTPMLFQQTVQTKLQQIPTELVRLDRISPALAMKFIGRAGVGKKQFEQAHQCSVQYDEQSLSLEVWCTSWKKIEITESLHNQMKEFRKLTLMEREIEAVSGSVRAVFSAGYEVKRLLFNDEIMSLHMSGIPSHKSLDEITQYIVQRTAIDKLEYIEFLHEDDNGVSVAVHLSDPAHATIIKQTLDNELWQGNKLSIVGMGMRPTAQPSTSVSQLILSWATSPSACEANVEFSSPEGVNELLRRQHIFMQEFQFVLGPITIKPLGRPLAGIKKVVNFNPVVDKLPVVNNGLFVMNTTTLPKTTSYRIKLSNLKSEVDEECVKQCICAFFKNHKIGDRKAFPKIVWLKHQDNVTMDECLNLQIAAITDYIPRRDSLASEPLSFFDQRNPNRAGFYLRYKSHEETQLAINEWQQARHNAMFNQQPIRIESQFTTTFSIHEALWKEIHLPFKAFAVECLEKNSNLTIFEKESKKLCKVPRKLFVIQSDQWHITKSITEKLQTILTPEEFKPSSEDMRKLVFSKVVGNSLKDISDTQSYIHWDKQKQAVYVYGATSEQRQQGKDAIHNMLTTLLTKFESFQFVFKHRKAAMDFNDLWKHKGKAVSFADHIAWSRMIRGKHQHAIELLGTKHGKTMVRSWMEKEGFLASDAKPEGVEDKGGKVCAQDCDVCFCEIGDSPYFLAGCNHGGCRPCFEYQFMSANSKEYVNTPFCCDFCTPRQVMALQDIRTLSTSSGLETIRRCAVNKYLREHPEIARRCPDTLKCEHVLDCNTIRYNAGNRAETLNGGKVLGYCDLCDITYCLDCSEHFNKAVKAHVGDSCEEARMVGLSDKRRYCNMITEACTLKCPNCSGAFTDFSGCCAVTCHCKEYFCGLCLQSCSNSGACHEHVRGCSMNQNKGNYFSNLEQINAAHKLIRTRAVKAIVKTIPIAIKDEVLQTCEKDLLDFQIYLFDVK